jgi:hypothetical protein
MVQKLVAILGIAVVGLMGCAQQPPEVSVDDAFDTLREAYNAAESAEEKVTLASDFLAVHPDSEYTGRLLSTVAYYQGHEMEDMEGALATVTGVLQRIVDPEVKFDGLKVLVEMYGEAGRPQELESTVTELQNLGELRFSDHLEVMEAATDAEAWNLVVEHAQAGLQQADAATFRADYPDEEYSDEDAEKAASKRRALAQAYTGWGSANQGQVDEALTAFAAGEPDATFNYVGVPETPLYRFWGLTAARAGDHERALELLARDAVIGGDETALGAFRESFAAIKPDGDFDVFERQTRDRLATVVDDFTLTDYDGREVSFSDSAGKVVLLAFWFPT